MPYEAHTYLVDNHGEGKGFVTRGNGEVEGGEKENKKKEGKKFFFSGGYLVGGGVCRVCPPITGLPRSGQSAFLCGRTRFSEYGS